MRSSVDANSKSTPRTARVMGVAVLCLLVSGCVRRPPVQFPPQPPVELTPEQRAQLFLGEPLAGLTLEQRAQFEEGKLLFQRVFTPEEGLGPLFNGVSCAACHDRPVIGGAGLQTEVHVARVVAPDSCDPLFERGGPVIQQRATPLLRALGISREEVPPEATAQGRRATPPLFGLGLVDAIPEASLLALEDPDDANGDGISGRVNRTMDGRVGRFGRKAVVAALFDFNAGAYPFEMGVTTPLSPVEETINGVPVPPEADPAPDPEIPLADLEKVTAFLRFLAPPPPKLLAGGLDRQFAERGRQLFTETGCAACHVPELETGPSDIAALDRKTVALYSDLLLHDLGPELADICLQLAGPSEFRTEMLMGLRFRERFLHDGSAKTVREAVERHGGEARQSRDQFKRLNAGDRKALLEFLDTI